MWSEITKITFESSQNEGQSWCDRVWLGFSRLFMAISTIWWFCFSEILMEFILFYRYQWLALDYSAFLRFHSFFGCFNCVVLHVHLEIDSWATSLWFFRVFFIGPHGTWPVIELDRSQCCLFVRFGCATLRRAFQLLKYGVVSTAALETDLLDWEWMYVSGRLHKPVLPLQLPQSPSLRSALQVPRSIHSTTASLWLSIHISPFYWLKKHFQCFFNVFCLDLRYDYHCFFSIRLNHFRSF